MTLLTGVKVSATEDGVRLHRWLTRHFPNANMILIRRLCRGGEIRINSKRCRENDILKAGDMVRIPPSLRVSAIVRAPEAVAPKQAFTLADLEKLRQTIIHNDDDIVIFNKPAGLAVQGGKGIGKSIDKMAAAMFPNDTVLLVHRLDKETSGILVVAKNHIAAQKLAECFQKGEIGKTYLALLSGGVRPTKGIVSDPIDGKRAATKYSVLGELRNTLSFVRFVPETGRKHQLRIHSANALGSPIVGDSLYGSRRLDARLKNFITPNRLYLFAERITFRHPGTGKPLTITASMPEWMSSVAGLMEVEL